MEVKILLLCERTQGFGGWYTYTRVLRDELVRKGHTVLSCGARGEKDVTYPVLYRPLELMSAPWRAIGDAVKLRKILEETQPDCIHITVEPYALLVFFLPQRWRSRIVLTIHGSYGTRPLERWRTRFLATYYYRTIPLFVTVSAYTRDTVFAFLKMHGSTVLAEHMRSATRVIPNAIVLPRWKPREHTQKKKEILLVGGVKPRKGVLEAIEACAIFRNSGGAPFQFHIIGGLDQHDSYVKRVQERILKLGLSDCITLEGEVSDESLEKFYEDADLYLMPALTSPTTFEGFGIVFIEAGARGVPSIGPNTSGAVEAIEEGASGYRVDSRDPTQIADRMRKILDERRIDSASCRMWAEKFSAEKIVRQIEEAYESLQK